MHINQKEIGEVLNKNVMINKNIIGIYSKKAKERVPEIVFFLIIMQDYPEFPPKILTKSNFRSPSLIDGSDLFKDICPNWTQAYGLKSILEGFLHF